MLQRLDRERAKELASLRALCASLASDLSSALSDIGRARAEETDKPRTRVVSPATFLRAATAATKQGARP